MGPNLRPVRREAFSLVSPDAPAMSADELRALLLKAGLSQLRAAELLGVNPRTMRRYCLGETPIPRVVEYAMLWLTLQTRFDFG